MRTLQFPSFPRFTDVKTEDLEWLSKAASDLEKLVLLSDLKPDVPYRVSGFAISYTTNLVTVTEGLVLYNSALLYFDGVVGFAFPSNPVNDSDIGFNIAVVSDPTDGHVLDDGNSFAVRKNNTVIVQPSTDANTVFTGGQIQDFEQSENLQVINGWATGAVGLLGGNFSYKRVGSKVYLYGDLDDQGATSRTICVLPENARPSNTKIVTGITFNGSVVGLIVRSNGEVDKPNNLSLTGSVEQATFSSYFDIQ